MFSWRQIETQYYFEAKEEIDTKAFWWRHI